nr:integrase, catalytic region, zinc finger, CCHC-type, peptidase aspartic, catalytic [Tanacetum cinerariifolium]
MASLADKAILSGADNRPPMLEKDMYDSWKSRMELYMLNRQHGRMILESVEHGPLFWPTAEEDGVTRLKKYSELSTGEAIHANCYVKATNIILQALPPEIYALVSSHKVAKDLWERIQTLMQGTPFTSGSGGAPDCDAINSAKIALMANLSHYGSDNLAELNDHDNMANYLTHQEMQERVLNELKHDDKASTSYEPSQEIESLKHTLSEHLKEKESLKQKIIILKNDFQKEKSRNIDRELALEKQALGFQNLCYLKKAQQLKPKLYDGRVIKKSDAVVIPDTEETLMLAEDSRSKMIEKQNDPQMTEKKVITKPINYAILNQLSTDFETRFIPQIELSTKQAFWSQYSMQTDEPNLSATTTIVEVPKELPKVSMVNSCLKKLKSHLANFDMVVKERTTATAITESTWGFEHTKACFRDDIIPFVKALKELFTSFDQYLIDEVTKVQHVFKVLVTKPQNKTPFELLLGRTPSIGFMRPFGYSVTILNTLDPLVKERTIATAITEGTWGFEHTKACFRDDIIPFVKALKELFTSALSVEIVNVVVYDNKNTLSFSESAPTFVEFFAINELKAQAQAKDTVILQLKEKFRSLKGDVTKRNVKREVEKIETINIELDHKEKVLVITALKEQLNKLKGKPVLTEAVSLNPIDPELLKVDVAPLVPKLRKNRTAHTDYIKHTQDEAATLMEIVERRTFKLVGNVCPLTRIATPTIVPPREPIPIVNSIDKPVVILVHTRKPKVANKKVPNKLEPNNSWGSSSSNVPSSLLTCRNDHVTKIMGYGDYQIRNVTISWVYYVEGLGHNLFSIGQFCDSDLEVSFRQHTCFIRNLDEVDLLTVSRGNNLYTLSLQDMMASSPICLLSKASKTKSWLWHRRLSHLNFGAINHLARQGLVRGLLKLKFKKGHLCSACAMGKSTKKTHKPKSKDTNQEKLYLLHMDLCGPMRVESVNGKKYILIIVDDYSRFTWEKVLVITALKEQLDKLKGKAVITKAVSLNPIDPELLKVDVTPVVPKLRKNRTAHIDYIRHTQGEAATLKKIVENERLLSPLNTSLDYACKYTRRIQELLVILQQTCPYLTDIGTKPVAVTPQNQNQQ